MAICDSLYQRLPTREGSRAPSRLGIQTVLAICCRIHSQKKTCCLFFFHGNTKDISLMFFLWQIASRYQAPRIYLMFFGGRYQADTKQIPSPSSAGSAQTCLLGIDPVDDFGLAIRRHCVARGWVVTSSQRVDDKYMMVSHGYIITHRIHGAAIYGDMDPINIPQSC